MNKIIKSIKIGGGIMLLFLSSFGVMVGIVAMIDPVGTKMSDDGDPFGVPPSFVESLSLTLFYAGNFFVGVWLILGTSQLKKILGTNLK